MTVQHSASDVLYSRVVQSLRSNVLSVGELADLTGVSDRQVHRWSTGTSKPEGESRRRLLEINYIVEQLRELYTDEGVEIWLHGRNKGLAGQPPIDLLRNGQYEPVLELVEALNQGVM